MAADGHLGMMALSRVTLASAGLSCFLVVLDSPRGPVSESAGWNLVTLEHFEKFKMASKMAASS